jgi:hypothetical protein
MLGLSSLFNGHQGLFSTWGSSQSTKPRTPSSAEVKNFQKFTSNPHDFMAWYSNMSQLSFTNQIIFKTCFEV